MSPLPNLFDATMNALSELQVKTLADIQKETSLVWAGRAMASFQLFHLYGDLHMLLDATDFMHEALEHAALSTDAAVLNEIREPLLRASAAAVQRFAQYRAPSVLIPPSMPSSGNALPGEGLPMYGYDDEG